MRAVIRISAIVIFALGFLCLPPSPGAHPYIPHDRFQSLHRVWRLAVARRILMIVGTILFIVSFIRGSNV